MPWASGMKQPNYIPISCGAALSLGCLFNRYVCLKRFQLNRPTGNNVAEGRSD